MSGLFNTSIFLHGNENVVHVDFSRKAAVLKRAA